MSRPGFIISGRIGSDCWRRGGGELGSRALLGDVADGDRFALMTTTLVGGHTRSLSGRRGARRRAALFSLLVALIRIAGPYLGVHWPGDVLTGSCFGTAWALLLKQKLAVAISKLNALPP